MTKKRRICVVTGSRADYGIQRWLMSEIKRDDSLELVIACTGMHLSSEFGLTAREIEGDGFKIDHKVEMLLSSDTPAGVTKSVGLGLIGFADVFDREKVDLVTVLGDRFETFAAASAAMIARVPVAHLHGGEITEGAIDESIRHAITKMSHLHFVSSDEHRRRVIQLGEDPERVFNFGAPGLDIIREGKFLDRATLEREIGFEFGPKSLLVTYHPVTLGSRGSRESTADLFAALDRFPDAHVLFTRPNADADGRVISEMLDGYAARHPGRVKVVTSLGSVRYLSAVRTVDAVVGNSSSALIEVPAFQKPTVNIGDRQKGRLRGATVIDCADRADDIARAIEKALSPEFKRAIAGEKSPYGDGTASKRIKDTLARVDLASLSRKPFHDLPAAGKGAR